MSHRYGNHGRPKKKHPPGKPVWVRSHWRKTKKVGGHYRGKPSKSHDWGF